MAKHVRRPGDASPFVTENASSTAPIPQVRAGQAAYQQQGQQGYQQAYPQQGQTAYQQQGWSAGTQDWAAGAQQGYQDAYYGQAAPTDYVPSQPRAMVVPAKKKKRHRFLKFIVFLIVAALIAAGVYLFVLNQRLGFEGGTPQDVVQQLVDRATGEPFYVLVLGSDSRNANGGSWGYSDIMMLVRVDEAGKKVTLLSIPRDSPYYRDDGSVVKINEAYRLGGPAESIRAANQLTGASISHYVEVDFTEFASLVDTLGGITVEVPQEMTVEDAFTDGEVTLQPGVQTLDGQQATAFVRGRKMFEGDQDAARQENVRAAASAILEKALDRPFYEVPGAVLSVADCVDTDIGVASLIPLAGSLMQSQPELVVYEGTGPTAGGYNEQYEMWLCYDNPQGWAAVMQAVDSGQDPSLVDANATAIAP